MLKYLFPKSRNPLVADTLKNRYNAWLCGKEHQHCIRVGSYYGMAQAWCRRCGHVNKYLAADHVPEWNNPD
jgi:hypothetical protein